MRLAGFDITRAGGSPAVEVDEAGNFFNYVAKGYGGFGRVAFSQAASLDIARTVAEVYFPIDAIAERAASVSYRIVDLNGEPVSEAAMGANLRRIMERPNAYGDLSTLVYDLLFCKLATGTAWLYTPRDLSLTGARWVRGMYALNPYEFTPVWRAERPDYYAVQSYADVLAGVRCGTKTIEEGDLTIRVNTPEREQYGVYGRSPLWAVRRNVELVVDVYNARRNVYEHNGVAGIICKEADKSGAGVFEGGTSAQKRKQIADELMERYNLSGIGAIKAITTQPVKFIPTLASIGELEPFRETYADAVAIAAAYQVPKHLIPTETATTYDNQHESEVAFWQNVVSPYANEAARMIGDALNLRANGWRVEANADAVPALQKDRNTELDTERKEIDNLRAILEMAPERAAEVQAAINKILDRYTR